MPTGRLHLDATMESETKNLPAETASQNKTTPAQSRTKIPSGLGLTLIICASLAAAFAVPQTLTALFGVSLMDLFSAIPGAENKTLTAAKLVQEKQQVFNVLSQAAYLGLSIYALIAGIQLKGYRHKGRKHALLWAKIALLYLVIVQIIYFAVTFPMQKEVYAELGVPLHTTMLIATDILGVLFSAVLPIIVWILLSGKKAEAACAPTDSATL